VFGFLCGFVCLGLVSEIDWVGGMISSTGEQPAAICGVGRGVKT